MVILTKIGKFALLLEGPKQYPKATSEDEDWFTRAL